jgi:hypothetical protein
MWRQSDLLSARRKRELSQKQWSSYWNEEHRKVRTQRRQPAEYH